MKRIFTIISALLLLSFSINNLTVNARPINMQISEGTYSIKKLKLMENTTYSIQNTSPGTVLMLRIDDDQQVMESHRLLENSTKYNIGPFRYVDKIVLLGPGTVTITE
ncbi:hypothetical protein [Clostridium beijerinckii]|uniref:hypothetical protein n=1 Tax=Clostridium beijerinckii TaxID=1520 RepID=UPI00156F1143|nr:hypothetical protein [Clostridium beijerinckii]NRT33231.1 hypothetical protein [Clostridium beijerinckii]NRT47343.1 hypothetical protein [Clostridium beijerinckii]NRT70014.1 hypothetical protein [Clostridium beijerinckii]NRZ18652.1 hypothetical protein [Clostridium beijerinckii]